MQQDSINVTRVKRALIKKKRENGALKAEMTYFVVTHPPCYRHWWHGRENQLPGYRYLRERL